MTKEEEQQRFLELSALFNKNNAIKHIILLEQKITDYESSRVELPVIILPGLKENDYIRTLTKPYTYALIKNPKYEVTALGTWVECEQMRKKDVEENRWYRADGTFHELSGNLLKVVEAKL